MISREIYTKIFLKELGKSTDDASVKMLMNKIWQSRRTKDGGGLRLSLEGYEFLIDEVGLESYEVPFSEHIELSPQTIIFFDRFMDCPYLLTSQSLIVFSEKKAFELHLFSDDIRRYGLIKAMNARKKEENSDNNTDI
jgi:hypothetical protein